MSKRREFIQQLLGGSIAGIPAVKSIETLKLNPQDTLVLKVSGPLSDEQRVRLTHIIKQGLPGYKVLVIGEELDLKVIRAE